MPNTVEQGQLIDVNMDYVAGPFPLVSVHQRFRVEVQQSVQPKAQHRLGQGADRHQQQPGNPPEGAALMSELRGQLRLLRPPLAAAHSASIRQCCQTA